MDNERNNFNDLLHLDGFAFVIRLFQKKFTAIKNIQIKIKKNEKHQ